MRLLGRSLGQSPQEFSDGSHKAYYGVDILWGANRAVHRELRLAHLFSIFEALRHNGVTWHLFPPICEDKEEI
jgi:hypothetical protein